MNILFLSLLKFSSFEERNIYTDLLRELIKRGHAVQAVCPSERRYKEKTNLKKFGKSSILTVKTYNIQKTNILEKGIGTLAIKNQFIKAIKKHLGDKKFDLILYPTPPITLCGVVEYFKKRDGAKTYLMLKDIFPQNAVDLGMIKTIGIKGLLYKHFRKQEKRLYSISDKIGCMSPANVEYVLAHNTEICKEKVEIFPNCIEVQDIVLNSNEKEAIRLKYGLPLGKKIFIYGGNLGKPQCVPFLIRCLKAEARNIFVFFVIIGSGVDFLKLKEYALSSRQPNLKVIDSIPACEFDLLVASCDVGMIFLDYRFTIPNFPSRILSYMQASLPVLCCVDNSTDIGTICSLHGFGLQCSSNDLQSFINTVSFMTSSSFDSMLAGQKANRFLKDNYSVGNNISKIIGINNE